MIKTKEDLKTHINGLNTMGISCIYEYGLITKDNLREAYDLWYEYGEDSFKHNIAEKMEDVYKRYEFIKSLGFRKEACDKYVNNEYFRWKTYSPYSPWNMSKKDTEASETLIQMSMDVGNVDVKNVDEVEETIENKNPYNLRSRTRVNL
jgi:hypothetical protein